MGAFPPISFAPNNVKLKRAVDFSRASRLYFHAAIYKCYDDFNRTNGDDYKKNDLGVAVGAGINLPLGLAVGARFTTSLNNIGDYRNISGVNDPELKNRVFQAYLSFQLGRNN